MFLIIMLSFAKVSEVSAIAIDDAEPAESGLNGLFNPEILCERFQNIQDLNDSDSNNNQTSG